MKNLILQWRKERWKNKILLGIKTKGRWAALSLEMKCLEDLKCPPIKIYNRMESPDPCQGMYITLRFLIQQSGALWYQQIKSMVDSSLKTSNLCLTMTTWVVIQEFQLSLTQYPTQASNPTKCIWCPTNSILPCHSHKSSTQTNLEQVQRPILNRFCLHFQNR